MIFNNHEQQFMASGETGGANWAYPTGPNMHDVIWIGEEYYTMLNDMVAGVKISEALRGDVYPDEALKDYHSALNGIPQEYKPLEKRWTSITNYLEQTNPEEFEAIYKHLNSAWNTEAMQQLKFKTATEWIKEFDITWENYEQKKVEALEDMLNSAHCNDEEKIGYFFMTDDIFMMIRDILVWPEDYSPEE